MTTRTKRGGKGVSATQPPSPAPQMPRASSRLARRSPGVQGTPPTEPPDSPEVIVIRRKLAHLLAIGAIRRAQRTGRPASTTEAEP